MNCTQAGCPFPLPGGVTAAHCGKCHQSFSRLTLFDAHFQNADSRLACRGPEAMKLVRGTSGVWYTPEGLKKSEARVATMNSARREKVAS